MFDTDNEIISFALKSWANKIETGYSQYSLNDVLEMKNSLSDKKLKKYIKYLTDDQRDLISRIRKIAKKHDANI